ncbi:MerR family transcriptional regulator [Romboutsia sp.]|uniref:MerR family transcriptional regulator n=1 Tax=Romboutsia sp. TaxID=1965302 RepID=UPI003F308906
MKKIDSKIENYFSIGEMAKLHNVSIETLRHYDRYDLLKPDYINENTGYRYYSMKSFIKMDIIKKCKAIGLALDEIKETMKNYDSLESILDTLEKQKEIVNKKVDELKKIKKSISNMQNDINESLEVGINKLFIKQNEKRSMIKYDYSGRYTKEFELKLRKTLLEVEKIQNNYNHKIVFSASYEDLIDEGKLTYIKTMISLDYIPNLDKEIVTLPNGEYLTMYFEDNFYNTKKYYNEMIKYIKENNIKVEGDFHEIYIMTRANPDGEIMALAQIEILLKK